MHETETQKLLSIRDIIHEYKIGRTTIYPNSREPRVARARKRNGRIRPPVTGKSLGTVWVRPKRSGL
jgi:hypothetical protein